MATLDTRLSCSAPLPLPFGSFWDWDAPAGSPSAFLFGASWTPAHGGAASSPNISSSTSMSMGMLQV
eukprot:4257779-Pyramimonas_sp.AAC.1